MIVRLALFLALRRRRGRAVALEFPGNPGLALLVRSVSPWFVVGEDLHGDEQRVLLSSVWRVESGAWMERMYAERRARLRAEESGAPGSGNRAFEASDWVKSMMADLGDAR